MDTRSLTEDVVYPISCILLFFPWKIRISFVWIYTRRIMFGGHVWEFCLAASVSHPVWLHPVLFIQTQTPFCFDCIHSHCFVCPSAAIGSPISKPTPLYGQPSWWGEDEDPANKKEDRGGKSLGQTMFLLLFTSKLQAYYGLYSEVF